MIVHARSGPAAEPDWWVVPVGSGSPINSGVTRAFRDDLEVYGRLENAFDEEYETIARYGTPGRALFVGVRQSF